MDKDNVGNSPRLRASFITPDCDIVIVDYYINTHDADTFDSFLIDCTAYLVISFYRYLKRLFSQAWYFDIWLTA